MTTGLKVVALVSGGKDSFFSILHCDANGHDVVALANLYPFQNPNEEAVEDIDSFMYQTIGHTVIPLYAEALGLPLYRQQIIGEAVNQHKSYSSSNKLHATNPDETESLVPLLRQVLAAHPEVNAVCTGAILSDYQRTRVESVALRLGLIPLSYLWQFPSLPPGSEVSLLEDMLAVGQDSRIIKVASGGLDESFLWQNVAGRKTIHRLNQAAQRFGISGDGAVLGEGGEFETLAVQGPWPVWKGKIVIEDADRTCIPGEAGTASLRIGAAKVVPVIRAEEPPVPVRIPPLFDDRFQKILDSTVKSDAQLSKGVSKETRKVDHESPIKSPLLLIPGVVGDGESTCEQTQSIMEQITIELSKHSHDLSDVIYTTIVMRNMADFQEVNAIYGRAFTEPNPPARVTIACKSVLPTGKHLSVAVSSLKKVEKGVRKGLHVQSRSYWAPANIGPYSQAIFAPITMTEEGIDDEVVYIAGQIPLVPASMEIIRETSVGSLEQFASEAVLALQHLFRVGARTNVRRFAAAIAFVVIDVPSRQDSIVGLARSIWAAAHTVDDDLHGEEDESVEVDVWDLKNRHSQFRPLPSKSGANASEPRIGIDDQMPMLTVILVDALPRGAQIEWVAYGLTGQHETVLEIPHLEFLLDTFKEMVL